MLLGIYKTFEELEDSLTLEEINLLLKADKKKEERLFGVLAAVNGIEYGSGEEAGTETAEEAMERLRRNAQAQQEGKTEEQVDLEALGIKFE